MSELQYEQIIDFVYTTLLMVWGGSCVGIGLIAVPFIFKFLKSPDDASRITSRIFKKQDILIRVIAICMLGVFYFKRRLAYSYEHFEWMVYVVVLHFFILGKVVSKRLWKLSADIPSFDAPSSADDPLRSSFRKWHILARVLYTGQIIGVTALLWLHAFGL